MKYPNLIKQLRMQREEFWKLKDFASALGISRAMMIQYEKGQSFPGLANLKKILEGLNTDLNTLYPKANDSTGASN